MTESQRITITLCGDGGAGKTLMALRLMGSPWSEEYDPTIEDYYSVTRKVDGRKFQLELIDTAGQEEYRTMWGALCLRSDAFLLVYDITNPNALDTLEYFTELIAKEARRRMDVGNEVMPVIIIAGNKCDLHSQREIKSQQGLRWAREHKCGFMETSTKEMFGIDEVFTLLVRKVTESRRNKTASEVPTKRQHRASEHSKSLSPQDSVDARKHGTDEAKTRNSDVRKPEAKRLDVKKLDMKNSGMKRSDWERPEMKRPATKKLDAKNVDTKHTNTEDYQKKDMDKKKDKSKRLDTRKPVELRKDQGIMREDEDQRGWCTRTFCCSFRRVPSTNPVKPQSKTGYAQGFIVTKQKRGWCGRTFCCSCKSVPSTNMKKKTKQSGWCERTFLCSCKNVSSTKMKPRK